MRTLGSVLFGLCVAISAQAAERLPRTLFIGDSQSCQTMGSTLDQKLRSASQGQTWTRARWGSSPHDWYGDARTTDGFFDHDPGKDPVRGQVIGFQFFPTLLSDVKPALVVIELGANLTWSIPNPDFIKSSVGRMIDDIKAAGARCFWIGPAGSRARPDMPELQTILIESVGGRCAYFDSIPITPYPAVGGDGLHFDYLGPYGVWLGKRWAETAYERLDQCMKEIRLGGNRSPECEGL